MATIILACFAAANAGEASEAASIVISYVADISKTIVYRPDDPMRFGWTKSNTTATGTPKPNGEILQRNAWQIADASTNGTNLYYYHGLGAQDLSGALRDGWRFSSYVHYPDEYEGEKPNMGLTAYLRGREYHLMLNLDASGDLFATLYDETPISLRLTSGGTGSAAFHNYELRNSGTNVVQFYFDGQLVASSSAWDGRAVANGHDGTVQWGNGLRAGTAKGMLNVNYVEFAIGPFNAVTGDVDGNRVVDGADFLLWQRWFNLSYPKQDIDADLNDNGVVDGGDLAVWKSRFGVRANPTALTIPEPEAMLPILLVVASVAQYRRSDYRLNSICSNAG